MKRTLTLLSTTTLLFCVFTANAAMPEEVFQRLDQQQQEARKKLLAAENATGETRHMMLVEHGKMMHMMMTDMHHMRPMDSMSAEDHKKWMAEHQKRMDEMMSQMMRGHDMMQSGCMMNH